MFPCLFSVCLPWSRLWLQGHVQKFINKLSFLPTLPLWPDFLACFSSLFWGLNRSEARLTLLGHHQLPSYPSQLWERQARGRGGAWRPSSHPCRTRPGSRPAPGLAPGGETDRQAPPFLTGVRGVAAARTHGLQQPLSEVWSVWVRRRPVVS